MSLKFSYKDLPIPVLIIRVKPALLPPAWQGESISGVSQKLGENKSNSAILFWVPEQMQSYVKMRLSSETGILGLELCGLPTRSYVVSLALVLALKNK